MHEIVTCRKCDEIVGYAIEGCYEMILRDEIGIICQSCHDKEHGWNRNLTVQCISSQESKDV